MLGVLFSFVFVRVARLALDHMQLVLGEAKFAEPVGHLLLTFVCCSSIVLIKLREALVAIDRRQSVHDLAHSRVKMPLDDLSELLDVVLELHKLLAKY